MQKKKKLAKNPTKEIPLHRVDHGELKKIAVALFGGQIFTTFHIRAGHEHLGKQIFMPALFLDDEAREKLHARKPHVFYEYLSEAGPLSINGYPIFTSMQMLVKEDWEIVVGMSKKMEEAAKQL